MAIDKLRNQVQEDLDTVNSKLLRARIAASQAAGKVSALEIEQTALQAALDALDGKVTPSLPPQRPNPSPGLAPVIPLPFGMKMTKLNGEDIILEPGFKVEKDAEGYESLVPDLTTAPAGPYIAPPIIGGTSDGFADPTKLI